MLLSSLEPCNDSANLDLQDKMHTFSLVTGCLWLRLCLSVQFITHCTPPWPPRLEPHGPAYSCSKAPVRGAALCSSCFLPQDAFPIQSVWQMHLPSFNLKDASSVKPFQTASHPHSLENQLLPLLGFAVTWPMCSSLICHHGWGHGQDRSQYSIQTDTNLERMSYSIFSFTQLLRAAALVTIIYSTHFKITKERPRITK